MESLEGQFLIASPHLPDSNFFRSVVLMIQHDDEGAFGLLLNRRVEKTIGELWEMISDTPCSNPTPVNVGGPVEGPLMAIHTDPLLSEREVIDGVHLSTEKDNLDRLVNAYDGPLRVFTGYSGWGTGQLEGEMQVGGWLTLRAEKKLVFADDETMWKYVTEKIGLEVLRDMIDPVTVPDDPSLN